MIVEGAAKLRQLSNLVVGLISVVVTAAVTIGAYEPGLVRMTSEAPWGGEFAKIIEEHTKPFEEVLWAADHSRPDDIAYRMKSDLAQAMELSRRPI